MTQKLEERAIAQMTERINKALREQAEVERRVTQELLKANLSPVKLANSVV